MIKDNQMTIINENGEEVLVNILFTYNNEERDVSYVVFYFPDDEENVMALRYFEDGRLEEIDDPDEFAEVEEVLNAYLEDPKIQELKEE